MSTRQNAGPICTWIMYVYHVYRTIRSRQANDLHHTIRPEKDPDVHAVAACLILYDTQKDRIASL
jgi:hypothetical protein